MANLKNKPVCIFVHNSFFNNFFEPERKKMEAKTGCKVSQSKFTEFLSKAKIKISYPKIDDVFAPRKSRRRRDGLQINF
jgi:hypothetical protein